ncbi:MAG TPA: glucarate dehydratase, partial [Actinopolymorphaceae bacterium]
MSVVRAVRVTPILIADPPLLNTQGVHQPYTPRTIVEVETGNGTVGVGETYGDPEYLELARRYADALVGRELAYVNGLGQLLAAPEGGDQAANTALDAGGLRGVRTTTKLTASVASAFETA